MQRDRKSEPQPSLIHENGPQLERQTTVRVLLFNTDNKILLQKVDVAGKPTFYITPGGRLDDDSEKLVDAVRREIREETGFVNFELQSTDPAYSGSHVMERSGKSVAMTEHFFIAYLTEDSDQVDEKKQSLTEEEKKAFMGQAWLSLDEIESGDLIIVPINLSDCIRSVFENREFPVVNFQDPPEFKK